MVTLFKITKALLTTVKRTSGQGISSGPFLDKYTPPPPFRNSIQASSLQRRLRPCSSTENVLQVSLPSQVYYGNCETILIHISYKEWNQSWLTGVVIRAINHK